MEIRTPKQVKVFSTTWSYEFEEELNSFLNNYHITLIDIIDIKSEVIVVYEDDRIKLKEER